LLKYINDPELRKQHGLKMKEFCIKNYNWDDIANHLILNVNKLLNGEEY
jgi:glycosyltransferase involved in cell wall biosynthesis